MTGKLITRLKGHTNIVLSLAFSPDGNRLISGSNDNSAILWNVGDHNLVHRLTGHTLRVSAVAFTPDGARAVSASDDSTLRLWRVTDGRLIAEIRGHTRAEKSGCGMGLQARS